MRLIALLLAVMMLTGMAAEVRASGPAAAAIAVDDAPDLVMPTLPEPVAVEPPDHQPPIQIEAAHGVWPGRMHAVMIFRPPRVLATQ